MGTVSIILPRQLSEKLSEKAEEMGYLPEELGVELLSKSLNEELDPEGLVEHYQFLSQVTQELSRNIVNVGFEDTHHICCEIHSKLTQARPEDIGHRQVIWCMHRRSFGVQRH